jgi:hypothetical protein
MPPRKPPKPPRPPKPPKQPKTGGSEAPTQDELDEVERAISLLGGRHPEHEKTRREMLAAGGQRKVALDEELAVRARLRSRRAVMTAVGAVVVVTASVVAFKVALRARALHVAVAQLEGPFTTRGFARAASNELTERHSLEADLPGSSCFVALATEGTPLVARSGATTVEGRGSVAWCSCEAAHATVEATPTTGPVGLSVVQADARKVGGRLARPWSDFTPGAWSDGGRECEDAFLDSWVAAHPWPQPALDQTWFDAVPERVTLRRAGFRVVSAVEASRPFGVVDAKAGDCMLAISTGGEPLSLRAPGGVWRLSHVPGALAWCSSADESTTVWRDGASSVVMLRSAGARIGGLLGTRECADAAGVHVAPQGAWLGDDDLAWDAATLLRASTVLDPIPAPLPSEPGPVDARMIAVALSTGARLVSDPTAVVFSCDPPLGTSAGVRESICAQVAPIAWWHRGDPAAGGARAALPAWLTPLGAHHAPDAVARIPELLTLARHLARDGFEPSLLEGVTELPDGIRVIGRAGEDAVVAIGLNPGPPWTLPYTRPDPVIVPWDLGDPPRVIPLEPGQTVKLVATPPSNAPLEKRRTVVFRRAIRI